MAELNSKLYCKKDGATEEISVYTTLDEVQNQGVPVKIDGIDGFVKYGDIGDENSSNLNCKVDGIGYRIHKTAIMSKKVILQCVDCANDRQISAVEYIVPAGCELYLNNENAPSVAGYDFVVMEGIRHTFTEFSNGDVFAVYYVDQNIPDRTKEDWSDVDRLYENATVLNTYSATNMNGAYSDPDSNVFPRMLNTSNVVDMSEMFGPLCPIRTTPLMDTSNAKKMDRMFVSPSSTLTTITSLDTRSAESVMETFRGCAYLENLPTLDFRNVRYMYYTFSGCKKLKTLTLLNASNVVNMYQSFSGCESLETITEIDTSKVLNMGYAFSGCTSLRNIGWDIDMSSCEFCEAMFANCPATDIRLKNVPKSLSLDTIGTTNYVVINYID